MDVNIFFSSNHVIMDNDFLELNVYQKQPLPYEGTDKVVELLSETTSLPYKGRDKIPNSSMRLY